MKIIVQMSQHIDNEDVFFSKSGLYQSTKPIRVKHPAPTVLIAQYKLYIR